MLSKSWPLTNESQRKKSRGWRSCPIIYRTGPSGILSGRSTERVQSCKRKDMCEEMQQGPSKKSRSGPSHTSGRGKKLWKKKMYPGESSRLFREYEKSVKEFSEKYQQVEYIEEGGYGQVFSGVRVVDNFPVAIKHIKWERVKFTDVELNGTNKRIPLEVHLLMKVGAGPGTESCSVTPVLLDWYDLGSEIVLVLERPEPCADMVIFRQLVDAAIVMESKGIFHRDIKPYNILIESGHDFPRARFIDFGIARTFTPGQEFDGPQGTPIYSSPEWFRSEPYLAGPTTVWQMGLVLYELFFNKLPLISEHTIGSKRGVPIPSTLSMTIRGLMKGCLEKDPSKRFFLQDVRNHPWLN